MAGGGAVGDLRGLYRWLDAVPLSRPRRNIARDFSDGGGTGGPGGTGTERRGGAGPAAGPRPEWPPGLAGPGQGVPVCPPPPAPLLISSPSAGSRGGEVLLPRHGAAAQLRARQLHAAEARQLGPSQ